jgi:hypothetical protein
MAAMRRAVPVLLLLCLAQPATAFAAPQREGEHPLTVAKARGMYNARPLPTQVAGVSVTPAEGIAAYTEKIRLSLSGAAEPAVDVVLPDRFGARAQNGRAYVPGRPTGSRRLSSAAPTVSFDVGGLPAGTYALPLRRGGKTVATAHFRLYAPRKEGLEEGDETGKGAFGPIGRVPIDSSGDST